MAILYEPEHLTYLVALRNLQAQGKLSYKSFSNDWVVKFWQGDNVHFMLSRVPDLNTQVSGEIATDKVGTYLLLADNNVPVVSHFLLNTPASPDIDKSLLEKLFGRYGQLVIKPTLGSMGRDVTRCSDISTVERLVASHETPSWAASPLIEIKTEMRLAVFDGQVRLAYEKLDPPIINGLKMFNLNLGATARDLEIDKLDPEMTKLAADAMKAIGLRLGAVDVIIANDGTMQVLEINSRFSVEHFASLSEGNYQKAVVLYEQLIEAALQS